MKMNKKRLLGWAVFVIIALLIPLVAMNFTDEINWKLADFIIMAIALSGIGILYEIIAQKSKNKIYRLAFGIGLLAAFLLMWVSGAVGIIGSENQDANLLYAAVFFIGLVGALISRFRPMGMSITLYMAALAQLLVPAVAIFIWPPSAISWSPGVVQVFLLSAFFGFLFLISGLLFKRAASNESLTT